MVHHQVTKVHAALGGPCRWEVLSAVTLGVPLVVAAAKGVAPVGKERCGERGRGPSSHTRFPPEGSCPWARPSGTPRVGPPLTRPVFVQCLKSRARHGVPEMLPGAVHQPQTRTWT